MKPVVLRFTLFTGLVCLAWLAFNLPGFAQIEPPSEPPKVVETVDIARYTGKWFEIAHIPMKFQRKCVGNTTAEYTEMANGRVSVFNSCEKADGTRQSAVAQAKVVEPETNAKLKVSFLSLPFFGWQYWAGGDYWILDLAPDYSTAIVGHPDRQYGWILSRTPKLAPDTLKQLAQTLLDKGYNPCDFEITPQQGGLSEKQPLCFLTSEVQEPETTSDTTKPE